MRKLFACSSIMILGLLVQSSALANLYQCPSSFDVALALKYGDCHYGFQFNGWSFSCDSGTTNIVDSFQFAQWQQQAGSGWPAQKVVCVYQTTPSEPGVGSDVYLAQNKITSIPSTSGG